MIEIHSFRLQKYRDLGNGDVPCQHGWSQNPQQRDVPHIFALTPTDRRSPKQSCLPVFFHKCVVWVENDHNWSNHSKQKSSRKVPGHICSNLMIFRLKSTSRIDFFTISWGERDSSSSLSLPPSPAPSSIQLWIFGPRHTTPPLSSSSLQEYDKYHHPLYTYFCQDTPHHH